MTGDESGLVQRVRVRAEQEAGPLPPRLGGDEVAAAERELGFTLPPLLRSLYCEIANGGYGPEYQLLPLTGGGRTAVGEYRAEYEREDPDGPRWPRGVLPVLDWGCGMYAAVDCTRPEAPVLLFEPNGFSGNWAHAWYQDAPSLDRWLTAWLDGNGWWEEDVVADGDTAEPEPWAQAAERIARRG
ncbi:SMI1/KNR4 family protein [Streptacidiphilus sp. PB12-B1b]|uniref:SMI1/KNR4 family protein n=1 Tax=Streptacidiphilus sp. PB12-B1b TaxID=2705012 RepID=UPI0015FCB8B1|nr:SMI1/KNR4 family protein [Streptacidiphilus sp. PB12-B1b]QMU74620.1 SMI1/KNR4 family protein [Streptacidiphilus sp. PB12-B1b]